MTPEKALADALEESGICPVCKWDCWAYNGEARSIAIVMHANYHDKGNRARSALQEKK